MVIMHKHNLSRREVSLCNHLNNAGIEVDYVSTIEGIAPGKATLRCILLCWTGDYPAQCEVGKFIKNGKHPCRRDKLEGIYIEN